MGCNFTCGHCQNWQIAHADATASARELRELPVANLPVLADHNDCQGVAWTYNEPTIWLEYVLDGAKEAHAHGLYTVMVTNGFITEEALDVLGPHIDAYRVDVKAFSDDVYRRLCRIPSFAPVLAAAKRAQDVHGCHVEIVTNVIPTLNDDDASLRAIAAWIASELGPKTPWHVTRFVPYLEFAHLPSTPIATLEPADRPGAACPARCAGRLPRAPGGPGVRLRGQCARARRAEHLLPALPPPGGTAHRLRG